MSFKDRDFWVPQATFLKVLRSKTDKTPMRRQTNHGDKRTTPGMKTPNHNGNGNGATADYRSMLLTNKREVLTNLGVKFDALATAGRVAEEDQAQVTHDEFVSLSLNRMEYQKLRQLQEALDRLEAGEYGVCQGCEDPIPPRRLQAVPWAKYCVKCQDTVGAEESAEESEPQLVGHR
jgi:RNA polymerase-binding transcription factor